MMALPGGLDAVASWLLTYLIHSSILMGAVWLLTRSVVRSTAWRETLWKAALVGALMTTTAASTVQRPGLFEISMPTVTATAVGDAAGLEGVAGDSEVADSPHGDGTTGGALSRDASPSPTVARAGDSDRVVSPSLAASWPRLAALGWLVLASGLLLRLGVRHARLRWVLRDRRTLTEERAVRMLAQLRRRAGVWRHVRLTATPAVATPLVLSGSEICVPERFVDDLGADEQRAALAHELGHLARRDPLWHLLTGVLEALFFFQPLHRSARTDLREAAEYRADEWAARHASRLSLARCLASVAEWVSPEAHPASADVLAMAEGGSPLLSRARRLVESEPERSAGPLVRYGSVAAAVLVTAGFGPAVVPTVPDLPADADPTVPAVSDQRGATSAGTRAPQGRAPGADTLQSAVGAALGGYLLSAAELGRYETALRLIESGADVDRHVSGDGTPLIAAARAGRLRIVELLLEHGADVNRPSPGDGNPLIMASAYGHQAIVATLVERGASVDAVVEGDETPLINAARSGHLDIVRDLVEHGADVNLSVLANPQTRPERRSPLGAAIDSGHDEIAEYLRSRGARLPR